MFKIFKKYYSTRKNFRWTIEHNDKILKIKQIKNNIKNYKSCNKKIEEINDNYKINIKTDVINSNKINVDINQAKNIRDMNGNYKNVEKERIIEEPAKNKIKIETENVYNDEILNKNFIHNQDEIKNIEFDYPYVWLRDNCQCNKCFNEISKSRIIEINENLFIKPIKINLYKETKCMNKNNEFCKNKTSFKIDDQMDATKVENIQINNTGTKHEQMQINDNNGIQYEIESFSNENSHDINIIKYQIKEILIDQQKINEIKTMNINVNTKELRNPNSNDNSNDASNNSVNKNLNDYKNVSDKIRVVINDDENVDDKLKVENFKESENTIDNSKESSNKSKDIDNNIKTIKEEEEQEEKDDDYKIKIHWENNHISIFNINWLIKRNFTKENRNKLKEHYKIKEISWKSNDFPKKCKKYNFEEIMNNDKVLLDWMINLSKYGVAIINNAPIKLGIIEQLANKISFLKQTQYGYTFRVEAKPGTSNVAYLSDKLQLHTDLPYYEYKPGINLLHYIQQAEGAEEGINQLTDCLAVCEYLKENHPEDYRILKETYIDWSDYGEDNGYKFSNQFRAPIIMEDSFGEIIRINFSQPQRNSYFNINIKLIDKFYLSLSKFINLINSNNYLINLKLDKGDILCFNNIRLVHGRLGYKGERLLEGGYLDWDLVRSKIRILKNELGQSEF